MPRVSVIIPTYNRAHLIAEAIDSVLAQTYRDFELIVVDDASTDRTRDVLEGYGDRIRVIARGANGGAGAARNDGIRESVGEFIAFLDADDLYLPTRLEAAVKFLDEHAEYGASYAEMLFVYPNGERPERLYVASKGGGCSGDIFDAVLRQGVISTQTVTIRRGVLDRVGTFDETLPSGQDWDLWWRLARATRIGYIDELACVYRVTPDGLSRSGVRAAASWVRRDRKALATFPDLTPSQRRLLNLRLYLDLRYLAFYLAARGRHREEHRACLSALKTACASRLWLPASKALVSLVVGQHAAKWAQMLRDRGRRAAVPYQGSARKA